MTDLFLGQTRSYGFQFISDGAAHTFTFPFQMDRVTFYNYTAWATTSNLSQHTWFRNMPAGDALQTNVIVDNGATGESNLVLETTNGFTTANTALGATDYETLIAGVSQADPCVITTTAAHGYQTDQLVRITDLGSDMPTARGMDEINNKRYRITVLTNTTFSLQDPVTDEDIDSTSFTAWVSGGRVMLESRSLVLNNPQVSPYSDTNPYNPTAFEYDPITYRLTAGTAVMGADSDQFYVECMAYGQYENLGDIA
jgi:hypothetical protein